MSGLRPGHFAMVMATAIVSVAMLRAGQNLLSNALLAVAAAEYAVLLAAFVVRPAAREQARSGGDAFGAFTFVAASTLLGERFHELGLHGVGWALIAAAALAWLALAYLIPAAVILQPRKPPVGDAVDGSWLLWVVATESIATGTSVAALGDPGLRWLLAPAAVISWSIGVLLYVVVITILSARLLLLDLGARPPAPTYWINMGATAITTLAGARILALPHGLPVVAFEAGAVGALSFLLWSFGTYLIPLLLLLSVWRGAWRSLGRYDVAYWSVVFPLGMYSVASVEFGQVTHLGFMTATGAAMAWPALAAWVAAGVLGIPLLVTSRRVVRRSRS